MRQAAYAAPLATVATRVSGANIPGRPLQAGPLAGAPICHVAAESVAPGGPVKPLEPGFDVEITTANHGGCMRLFTNATTGIKDLAGLHGKTASVSDL